MSRKFVAQCALFQYLKEEQEKRTKKASGDDKDDQPKKNPRDIFMAPAALLWYHLTFFNGFLPYWQFFGLPFWGQPRNALRGSIMEVI